MGVSHPNPDPITLTLTPSLPISRLFDCSVAWIFSGTPVQNNLGELLALLSFLMPHIFRSDVIETLLEFLGENAGPSSSSSSSSSSFQVRKREQRRDVCVFGVVCV